MKLGAGKIQVGVHHTRSAMWLLVLTFNALYSELPVPSLVLSKSAQIQKWCCVRAEALATCLPRNPCIQRIERWYRNYGCDI